MNILVTGGAGFIGSHLIDYLIKERHNVICVDNLSLGEEENIKKEAKKIDRILLLPKMSEMA